MTAPVTITSARAAGALACTGLLLGEFGGALMHFPPFRPQRVLRTVPGSIALVLLAAVTVGALIAWARAAHPRQRFPLVVALLVVGGSAVAMNVLAPALGWWAGPVFQAPLLPLALLTGLRAMFVVGVVLVLYRWVATYRRWLAALVYVAILIALIPGTVRADEALLHSGVLVFGRGYRIWHDVLLGEWFFVLPLLIHEALAVHPTPTAA